MNKDKVVDFCGWVVTYTRLTSGGWSPVESLCFLPVVLICVVAWPIALLVKGILYLRGWER